MDVLLAGKRTLPLFERVAYRVISNDAFARSLFRDQHDSGIGRKLFVFRPNPCSTSTRNPVRLQPGIVFALDRNPHKSLVFIAVRGLNRYRLRLRQHSVGTMKIAASRTHIGLSKGKSIPRVYIRENNELWKYRNSGPILALCHVGHQTCTSAYSVLN
jgi:hypothetical protein